MEQEYVDYSSLAGLLAPQTQALQALAMRPQKTSAVTTTTSSSTPRALQNMIENRDRIRTASRELDDALKARETLPYTLANALSNVPQQQGYGSWLSDFARGLGTGGKMLTDAQMARAQMKRQNEMEDLAEILAYDKAMGDIGTQTQRQEIGYTELPWPVSGAKGAAGSGAGGSSIADYLDLPDQKIHELNVNAGRWESNKYDTQDKSQTAWQKLKIRSLKGRDFGVDKADNTKQAQAYEKYETLAMKGMFDVLKVLRPATDTDVLTALKAAGADPTMDPKVRDMRLTDKLNSELRKAGRPGVQNLKHWDATVDYWKQTGVWDPASALNTQNRQPVEQQTVVSQQIYTTPDGRKFRRVGE